VNRIARLIALTVVVLSGCAVDTQEDTTQFLLIFRERLGPGSDDAYNRNELQLATVCATLGCPHSYLAMASLAGPREVWWLNAFASQEERDALEPAYARNEPLMAAMRPLGARKEEFRESSSSTMTTYRRDLSGGVVLQIKGTRFFVISTMPLQGTNAAAVFESPAGERFHIASATNRAMADAIAEPSGSGGIVLAVEPQWSFPDKAWITADPDFWSSTPAARSRED
jgi:hypothetical protein